MVNDFLIQIQSALEGNLAEGDGNAGSGTVLAVSLAAITAGVNFMSQTISLAGAQSLMCVIIAITSVAETMNVFRDGVLIGSKTLTANQWTSFHVQDSKVAAALHSYSIQFTANGNGAAIMVIVARDLTDAYATQLSGGAGSPYCGGKTPQTGTASIALTQTGTCRLYILSGGYGAISADTITLYRDGVSIQSWTGIGGGWQGVRTYNDTNVTSGTRNYSAAITCATAHYAWICLIAISNGVS
jgi:hypothetical protein